MGTVTVGGSQYSTGGEKQFKEDVVLQLGAHANKIKDLDVITDDLINEGLSFKDWPALVQEVHSRNVGYQAASVMEALMKEHTGRYKKAQDAIKAFNKEADETWSKEVLLEPSKRVKYGGSSAPSVGPNLVVEPFCHAGAQSRLAVGDSACSRLIALPYCVEPVSYPQHRRCVSNHPDCVEPVHLI